MAMINLNNIRPLTDFRKNIKQYLAELNEKQRPIVLTQHGKSTAVLLDPETFQKMQDQIEFMRKVALGLEDDKQGRVHSMEEIFDELDNLIESARKK